MGKISDELDRLRPTLRRLTALADEAEAAGYRSGDPTPIRTVRIRRSSGAMDDAVVVGFNHAGLTTMVKLRHSKGGKAVSTSDLLELNPWLGEDGDCQ